MTTEKLIEKAREYHAAAMTAITAAVNGTMDCGESRKRTITNFINAEFSFGKYHGIMEILEQQDMRNGFSWQRNYKRTVTNSWKAWTHCTILIKIQRTSAEMDGKTR